MNFLCSQRPKRLAILGGRVLKVPTLAGAIRGLAVHYDTTVYSDSYQTKADPDAPYRLRSVSKWWMPPRLREVSFGLLVLAGLFLRRADVIYSHSTFPSGLTAVIVGRMLRIPVVVGLEAGEGAAVPDIGFGSFLKKRMTMLEHFVLKQARCVCTLTEFHAGLVRKNLSVPSEKIRVIPRGIDVSQFSFAERSLQPTVRFLNVEYMHAVKDQDTLLRCFAILSRRFPCTLTLVGKDYWNGRIRALAVDLGIERYVRFEGFVPYSKCPRSIGTPMSSYRHLVMRAWVWRSWKRWQRATFTSSSRRASRLPIPACRGQPPPSCRRFRRGARAASA